MKLRITIIDTETGDVLHTSDASAVIAGCKTEDGTAAAHFSKCDDFDLASAISATEGALRSIKKQKGIMFALATKLIPLLLTPAKRKATKAKATAETAETTETSETVETAETTTETQIIY